MRNNRPNDKDNPLAPTLQKNDEFAMTITPNGAADCSVILHDGNSAGDNLMSFPNMTLPLAPPWEKMHSTYQPCTQELPETGGNLMADFMMLNTLQNPKIDPNSKTIRTNTSRICSLSEVSFPDPNMRGIPQYINQDYTVAADDTMSDGAGFSNLQNLQNHRNFMLMRNAAGGYQMSKQDGEAKTSSINRPQINGHFVCSPMLFHSQDTGQIQTGNNVKVSADRRGFQEKIDGSFLRLGVGGYAEARSLPKFSSREISSKLEEAVSPKLNISHVQQTARSSSRPGQHLAAGFPGFEINAGGFSNPVCNAGRWTSSNNDVGAIHAANNGPGSSPFHISQTPQDGMQHNISMIGDWNSSFVGYGNVGCAELDLYRAFQTNQAALSGALDSNSAGFLSSREIDLSGLAPEFAKPAWITTQTTSDQLQNAYETAKNLSLESPMNCPSVRLRGISTKWSHAGKLYRPPDRISTQLSKNFVGPSSTIGRPVDVVPIQYSSNLHGPSSTAGKLYRPPNRGSTQLSKNFVGPSSTIGQPVDAVPSQYSSNLHGPSSTAVGSVDGLSQRSVVYGRPSLKRSAIQPPPAARWVQRQKMTRPIMHPSIPYPPQTIPPIPATAPAAAHIKWQGSDGPPQPSGQKCLLCKRDLSFTPEGAVYQPTTPPAVAVLPCGHTFHDQCLQNIIPEDQCKNPPCIPCAIGEN